MSYVWALLGFCALIILHEGGHFVAAKAVGMRVEKFSLFFGPMIVRKRIGETLYGIGVIPLGGFVKITGMSLEEIYPEVEERKHAETERARVRSEIDALPGTGADRPAADAARLAALRAEEVDLTRRIDALDAELTRATGRAYVNQPVWKRIVVILAGPVVNLVIAFGILFVLLLHDGRVVAGPEKLYAITEHSAAAAVVPKDSELVAVDGQTDAVGIRRAVDASRCPGKPTNGCVASPAIRVTVRRDGKLATYSVHPRYSTADKRVLVGVTFAYENVAQHVGILGSARYSVATMGQIVGDTFSTLGRIWESKERKQLQGVVGIYALTQQAVSEGPSVGLSILAEVSLALGVFNLLPFLPLDGGHIFWALVEKLRRRRVSMLTMERASYVGLALVLILFVIGMSNSITTLTHGGYHLR